MKEIYTKKEVQSILADIMASLKQGDADGAIVECLWMKNNGKYPLYNYIIDRICE